MKATTAKEREIAEKAKAILAARGNVHLGKPLPVGPTPKLVRDDTPRDVKAWQEAVDQVRKAKETLALPASAFMHYPLPALGQLVGGVRPNRVHQIVMASNVGKTTTAQSFIEQAVAQDQRCAIVTTETTSDDFRLRLAASEIGVKVGDVATGAYLKWPNANEIRRMLEAALDKWADYENGTSQLLKIATSGGYLTPQNVRGAMKDAADLGVDWFLVDHEDHVEAANGMSEPQMSNAVNGAIWASTVDFDMRTICFSQLNQDVFRHNPLGMCMHPQEHWVKYGSKKKELCWVMLGGSRPLRRFADEKERETELAAYKAGERTIADITLPGIAFRLMKHRDYGERVGSTVICEVQNGRIVTPTAETAGHIHGIRTNRDVA